MVRSMPGDTNFRRLRDDQFGLARDCSLPPEMSTGVVGDGAVGDEVVLILCDNSLLGTPQRSRS